MPAFISKTYTAIALTFVAIAVSPQSVQQVAALRTARSVHTATTLASGRVLVVGGMADGGGSLNTVELFDPATNTSRIIATMSDRRAGHTATQLADGRVVVAGGYNGEYLASIEVFDPATQRLRAAGSLIEGRSGHTATLLPDGRILFAGGVGRGWTFLASAEVYDPATGRSETVGAMLAPRESHTATSLPDGGVLITGGHAGRHEQMQVYASAEIYSPRTRRFSPTGVLGTARHKHDAIALSDGRVLVIGGADRTDRRFYATTEIFDPRTSAFEPGPTMANERYKINGTSVLLPGGNVLVTSGAQSAELLDMSTRRFRTLPGRFPAAFRFAAVAQESDGRVFVFGGYSESSNGSAGVWRVH